MPTRMRRSTPVLVAAALAAGVLAVPAVAGGPQARQLTATGQGRAQFEGSGFAYGQIIGKRAQISVKGDAILQVNGRQYRIRSSRTLVTTGRWSAAGVAPGTWFRVEVRAPGLAFCVAGTGAVRLEGSGSYLTDVSGQTPYTRAQVQISQATRSDARRPNRNAVVQQALPSAPPPPLPVVPSGAGR